MCRASICFFVVSGAEFKGFNAPILVVTSSGEDCGNAGRELSSCVTKPRDVGSDMIAVAFVTC
jgi:hypothetical protein